MPRRLQTGKIAVLLLCVVAFNVAGAEAMFNFDTSDCGWISCNDAGRLQRSDEYPTDGARGLLFTGPAWDRQHQIWPAFEPRAVPKDWTKYDRLVIPVFNDAAVTMPFNIFIGDTGKPFREGAHFQYRLSPYSSRELVLKLKPVFENRIDPEEIAVIHCYTENPESEMRFFVGGFTLLEPGEALPALPETYQAKVRERQKKIIDGHLKQLKSEAAAFDFSGIPPEAARRFRNRIDELFARFRNETTNTSSLLAEPSGRPLEWSSIRARAAALSDFALRRQSVAVAPGYEDVLLGYATSMEKVLPRVPIFQSLPEEIVLDVARNERESCQLIVMPQDKALKSVRVRLSAFTGPAGTLADDALSAVAVGFVETKFVPRSGSEYVGFWPDPLLAFLDEVDINANEAQPFWIKADIPEGQAAGVYTGKAEVVIDGKCAFAVPMSILVRDFTLPKRSLLPLAVTFWPNDGEMEKCNPQFDPEARKSPASPVNAWKKHKKAWCEFMAGYYLMIDSLYEYGDWTPELELFVELDRTGRLGRFNLGYFPRAAEEPTDQYGMQRTIDRIRPRYEKAKELGILDHAYIYGCDEFTADKFPSAERAASILKQEFPEVPLFTTCYDKSFGMDGRLASIDYFCPLTPSYDPAQAAAARAAGKQVWWYICLVPARPYANNFIESSGIETRLLMGAMSAKYRPDGFLYYQTSLWNNTAPITAGPYTDWVAQSFPGYNGDGNWSYPGPDGTPLGSIRLENFRDGLEDYSYVKLLETLLAEAEKSGADADWCREAEEALQVPVSLVESLTEYTRDSATLYKWRSRLAELIERAPVR